MTEWTYQGETGCKFWGDLGYDICNDGRRQSPININTRKVVEKDRKQCDLKVSKGYDKCHCRILNTGFTVKCLPKGGKATNCKVTLNDTDYYLIQFHFHSPAEHRIDNKLPMLELHLVHQSDEGDLTVLGFIFEIGDRSTFLEQFWEGLPKRRGKKKKIPNDITFDELRGMHSDDAGLWRYDGSLTTPPCSEGVNWVVYQQRLTCSRKQLENYKKRFPMKTNRPVQNKFKRRVTSYQS
eukprot:maker-scaffold_8-snap-gene-1.40-mRNA-1 protein AED:0.04 eAED:0.04 QI:366/1/1/1/1/1/5/415/237